MKLGIIGDRLAGPPVGAAEVGCHGIARLSPAVLIPRAPKRREHRIGSAVGFKHSPGRNCVLRTLANKANLLHSERRGHARIAFATVGGVVTRDNHFSRVGFGCERGNHNLRIAMTHNELSANRVVQRT